MVRINDDYIIEVDSMNFTLMRDLHRKKKVRNTAGEEYEVDAFSTVGYFSTLSGAIKGAINDMNVRKLGEGVHTLKETLKIVNDNNRRFSELLESVLEVKET